MALYLILNFPCNLGENTCVKVIYDSQVGIRELTGNNDGESIEAYLASTGLGPGYPWCAAFVNWTFVQCCIETVPSPAWSPSWFPASNTIWVRSTSEYTTPQSGDVFGIYFRSKERIAHVGFIDRWVDGSGLAETVEGNTNNAGSREGDGVYRKKRLKKQIHKISRFP